MQLVSGTSGCKPLIYLNDRSRFPMQLILRNIVLGTDAALSKSMSASADMATMSLNIKYAVIFITILPILMVYPSFRSTL